MSDDATIGELVLEMGGRGWSIYMTNVPDKSGPPETWNRRVWVVTLSGSHEVAGRAGKGGGVVVALGRQPSLMDALNEARADAMGKEQGA
jgi:hypothetical protein